LPFNVYADIVQDEFPEKELARITEGSVMDKESPILREGDWLSRKSTTKLVRTWWSLEMCGTSWDNASMPEKGTRGQNAYL
jgi:hypothetical protein